MPERPLNATAASLLGFLHEGPLAGWDLVQTAQREIGDFWSLTRSQVYRELAAMAAAGLVEAGERGRRDRRPYSLTEAGREALAAGVGGAEPYAIATLEFGIAYERAVLGWFDRLPSELRGPDAPGSSAGRRPGPEPVATGPGPDQDEPSDPEPTAAGRGRFGPDPAPHWMPDSHPGTGGRPR